MYKRKKGKVFYGQENLLPQNAVSIINYLQELLKQPNGELLVAVNHNQLRTMASETVDPIDWSHPPPSWAVPPEGLVQSINQCNLSGTRTCNRSMRVNHLAYAATQGIISKKNRICAECGCILFIKPWHPTRHI